MGSFRRGVCLFILGCGLVGCAAAPDYAIAPGTGATAAAGAGETKATLFQQVSYLPIDPIFTPTYTDYVDGKPVEKPWSSIKKEDVRDMLPNQSSETVVKKFIGETEVKYVVFDSTVKGSDYEVIMEWMKYRLEPITYGAEKYYGKVGVGVRVRANVRALAAGVNLNGLVGLAAAVKASQLQGSIKVNLIGIDSSGVSALLPIGVTLDESSIQLALQTLSAIQTKVYDDQVILTPHITAVLNDSEKQNSGDPARRARAEIVKQKPKL